MMMRDFSLLVKPAGSSCNLDCPYCFYRDRPEGRMTDRILRRMIQTYLEAPMMTHSIAFQGGEPLLMGENFFRKAAEYAEGRINFSVQTNATLVTESMAKFFAENGWLIGVSPHWAAMAEQFAGPDRPVAPPAGYRRLVDAGCEINVLQLVTKDNVAEPEKLYHYIRDNLGARFHQYIECSHPAEYAINSEQWGDFLQRLFDEWRRCGDEHRISVRQFDAIVSRIMMGREEMCQFAGNCSHYLVVDQIGDLYPCDFYVDPQWRLGSVFDDNWPALRGSPRAVAFAERKRDFFDCPRSCRTLDDGWQRFFAYATPQLADIVNQMEGA